MSVKIYLPAKKNTQSAGINRWVLRFESLPSVKTDCLMGWNSGKSLIKPLYFPSCEAAIQYAEDRGLQYEVLKNNNKIICPKSYSDNFTKKLV